MKTSFKTLLTLSTLAAFATMPFLRADNATPAASSTSASVTAPVIDQKAGHEHQDRHLAALAKQLGLTDAQKAKLAPIMEDRKAQIKALRADTTLSDDQRKTKRREIKDAIETQIRPLLTADQQQKFDARGKHHNKDNVEAKDTSEKT